MKSGTNAFNNPNYTILCLPQQKNLFAFLEYADEVTEPFCCREISKLNMAAIDDHRELILSNRARRFCYDVADVLHTGERHASIQLNEEELRGD